FEAGEDRRHLPEVSCERHDPYVLVGAADREQLLQGSVIGSIVDEHDLVSICRQVGRENLDDLLICKRHRAFVAVYGDDEGNSLHSTAPAATFRRVSSRIATIMSQIRSTSDSARAPYSGMHRTS